MAKRKKSNSGQNTLFRKESLKIPKSDYSRDMPNRNMRNFVGMCSAPFDGSSDKPIMEFSGSLEGNRHSALYNFLGYPSKKPYEPIEQYIRYFSKPGDLLFDPFCGAGGLGTMASRIDRHCILIDSSPIATMISKAYCTYLDPEEIEEAFEAIRTKIKGVEPELYGTKCHLSNEEVNIQAAIWSQTYRCVKCFEVVPLKSAVEHKFCPNCSEKISTRQERLGYVPWGVRYRCPTKGEKITRSINGPDNEAQAAFKKWDIPKLVEQSWDATEIGFVDRPLMNHTDGDSPWGVLWRPYHGNTRTVSGFFTNRNLYAVQTILNEIIAVRTNDDVQDLLRLALANILPSSSRQQRHYPGSTFPNMVMPGVLYIPPINEEINVFRRFLSKRRSLVRGQKAVNEILHTGRVLISTQDSRDLNDIPGNTIDYCFTDPPYSGRIQFGELNFIQEAVLGLDTEWLKDEVIVNGVRGFSSTTWQDRLLTAMREVFRVLKPGSWISVCFHDSDPTSWERLQDVMLTAGFLPGSASEVSSMETGWQTLKMHTSEDITKRDLIVNYRKPMARERMEGIELSSEDDDVSFAEKVSLIIRDTLESNPGQTKDRIYDEAVSRMVRTGHMEAHNFDELLRQVADEVKQPVMKDLFRPEDPNLFGTHEISRWYLKETDIDTIDTAESAKEDEAAERITEFIKRFLADNPHQDGVHYSDLFEHYVYTVKDKPRRSLAEWLLDYYYKTESGTYRLPASEEEEKLKAEGRAKGTNRHIRRYVAYLEQGVAIPEETRPNDATLAEWIRHCKRSGLYDQGKLLYEKGGLNLNNLPEEVMVNVEEDYQVCVRMLGRSINKGTVKKSRRGGKKKVL